MVHTLFFFKFIIRSKFLIQCCLYPSKAFTRFRNRSAAPFITSSACFFVAFSTWIRCFWYTSVLTGGDKFIVVENWVNPLCQNLQDARAALRFTSRAPPPLPPSRRMVDRRVSASQQEHYFKNRDSDCPSLSLFFWYKRDSLDDALRHELQIAALDMQSFSRVASCSLKTFAISMFGPNGSKPTSLAFSRVRIPLSDSKLLKEVFNSFLLEKFLTSAAVIGADARICSHVG